MVICRHLFLSLMVFCLGILKMQRNSLTGRLPSELGRMQNLGKCCCCCCRAEFGLSFFATRGSPLLSRVIGLFDRRDGVDHKSAKWSIAG